MTTSNSIDMPSFFAGPKPGLVDPSQPARLLRHPNSTLTFATFDPLAATGRNSRVTANTTGNSGPTRIVIETIPHTAQPNRWRYVPPARRAAGVHDEGPWPRFVDVCGLLAVMTEEQWDIYKLDPMYDCYVPPSSESPVITRLGPSGAADTRPGFRKRRAPSPGADGGDSASAASKAPPRKYRKASTNSASCEASSSTSTASTSSSKTERATDKARGKQREVPTDESPSIPSWFAEPVDPLYTNVSNAARSASVQTTLPDQGSSAVSPSEEAGQDPHLSTTCNGTGTAMDDNAPSSPSNKTDEGAKGSGYPNKRPRTQPATPQKARTPDKKERMRRRQRRDEDRLKEKERAREARDQRLVEEIMADAAAARTAQGHEDAIAESRRKMAELEQDRPLWEAAAKQRAAEDTERRAQEAAQAAAEKARLQQIAADAAAAEERRRAREAQERQRAAAAAAAAEAERRAKIEQMRQQRRIAHFQRWGATPFTAQIALQRYLIVSEEFDAAKFSRDDPIDPVIVPWPVQLSPRDLNLVDIDWTAVEDFFKYAERVLSRDMYRFLVTATHKRFHPDRWSGRGIFKSIDEDDHPPLLKAVTTVSQVASALWTKTCRG
ncbi:hypothetical protein C8Q76DRAFT_695829 [Earliella scabrosa]|nr:hypothetical protein C8Q76DRAFT_695829 [Earliella scabrosa]